MMAYMYVIDLWLENAMAYIYTVGSKMVKKFA